MKDLNSVHFYGCEDFKAGEVLYYFLRDDYFVKASWKQGFRMIISFFIALFTVSYKFKIIGEPNTLFIFSNSYRGRDDHLKAFEDAAELCDNRIEMIASKRHFYLGGIKYLKYILKWNSQVKNVFPDFGRRMLFLRQFFQPFVDYEYFKFVSKKNNWNVKNLVVYCDVMSVDFYFVQKFNSENKNTITLQHGNFGFGKNFKIWAAFGSRSKYFLSESPCSSESIKEAGYKGKIITVGSPHQIKINVKKPLKFENKRIGIFFNGQFQPSEDIKNQLNIEMLDIVQKYCRKNGQKLLLKYHPGNNPDDYQKYIDKEITIEYGREILASDFSDMIDVAVMSISTVFLTMLKKYIPTIFYEKSGYNFSSYPNTDEIQFHDSKSFEDLLEWIITPDFYNKIEKYRNYFLASGNIADNYLKAFKQILLKGDLTKTNG